MAIPAANFIYNVYFHPLAGFPGPLLYRGSNVPKVIQELKGNLTIRMHELHQRYGPVVRVAPGELTFISAPAWRDICTGTSRKGGEPMPMNNVLGQHELEWFGAFSLLWQVNNTEHGRQRRAMAPSFSDKSLRQQEPIFTKYADLFVRRMHENAGTTVDLCGWFHYITFDIIGDLTFGESFDCLEQSRCHPWINFIFSRLRMMQYGQVITAMGHLGAVIKMMIPKRIQEEIISHISHSKDKVDRRRAKESGRHDFMTHILDQIGKEDGLSLAELYANAQTLVMAGSETSATLLAVAGFNLMTNPEKLQKLAYEIRSTFDTESDINFVTISKLPYLNAVINESLRIQPPIPAGIHRFVPPGGGIIDGRFVAEGTDVHVPQWAANHSPDNFRDPDRFVPERWLGDNKYAGDQRDVFQPFSVGPRNCIGRSLAYMETRLILAKLIWNFDLELMPESRHWDIQKTFLLYEKGPLYSRLTPVSRSSAPQQPPEMVVSEKAVGGA